MRTIQSLLEYNLTEYEKSCLDKAGVINGIGGEGQNIEKILLQNIELLPGYDINKAERLLEDIRELSVEHDIQYFFKTGFYSANYKFAKKLFHLLHWSGYKRFAIALIAFIILNKFWKKFYFCKKSV